MAERVKFTRDYAAVPNDARYAGTTHGGEIDEHTEDLLDDAAAIIVLIEPDGEKSYFVLA